MADASRLALSIRQSSHLCAELTACFLCVGAPSQAVLARASLAPPPDREPPTKRARKRSR